MFNVYWHDTVDQEKGTKVRDLDHFKRLNTLFVVSLEVNISNLYSRSHNAMLQQLIDVSIQQK